MMKLHQALCPSFKALVNAGELPELQVQCQMSHGQDSDGNKYEDRWPEEMTTRSGPSRPSVGQGGEVEDGVNSKLARELTSSRSGSRRRDSRVTRSFPSIQHRFSRLIGASRGSDTHLQPPINLRTWKGFLFVARILDA